jgi:hypothetical protein
MGFKLGAVVGFGAGYYLGAKAGRERYVQLNRWVQKLKQTDAYQATSAKARGLADEGIERAKDVASARTGAEGTGSPGTGSPGTGFGADADPTVPDISRN